MKKHLQNILLIISGAAIFAVSVNSIIIPNALGQGGITGFVLFLNYTIGVNIAVTSFMINVFLLIIGWKFLDKLTIIYTLTATSSISFFLEYIHLPHFIPESPITASIAIGILVGISVGIVVVGNGSTGGTDIIALILNKFTGISFSNALFILDLIIVTLLTFVIGLENGIITIISIYISTQIINFILAGLNPKQAFYIVSNKYEDIGEAILKEINRGCTVLKGYGFYSKEERNVLFVVVSRRQVLQLQRLVQFHDPNAFITVSAVQEVHGEGFTYFLNNKA